jgi:nitroimidazol reductase NimA-like FMN-containing flavoprotein (pyridoxamine 5'-phosphate oxidase superfamily)
MDGMTTPPGTEILSDAECSRLLAEATVGRLAVDIAGRPDIFPINYIVVDDTIVFRSAAGTKLAASVLLHYVAFEIDGYEPSQRTAWSVVVKGRAHQIERMQEVYDAQDLPLFPWVASEKPNFVRITPDEVSGRRFHVIDDVAPDASLGWQPTQTAEGGVGPEPDVEYHAGDPYMHPD